MPWKVRRSLAVSAVAEVCPKSPAHLHRLAEVVVVFVEVAVEVVVVVGVDVVMWW